MAIKHGLFMDNNCVNKTDNHKLHTLAYNKICRPKYERGLGIGRIEDINAAYLVNGKFLYNQTYVG